MMETIGIIGGSGLVGRKLGQRLIPLGFRVKVFSRNPEAGQFQFDYRNHTSDVKALSSCEILINLAGANVGAHRWTSSYKKEIYDSRVLLTEYLAETLQKNQIRLKLYIGASATGYYQEGTEAPQNEFSDSGNDFLSSVCQDWEKAHQLVASGAIRNIVFRTGVVMSDAGGFIPRLLPIIRLGLGAPLGSGKQIMPWISLDDLVEMFIFTIQNETTQGVYNAVSPELLSNREAMMVLCEKMNKKCWLPPVPSFVIKAMFGEFSVELLGSRKVEPMRMLEAGFIWRHPRFSGLNLV